MRFLKYVKVRFRTKDSLRFNIECIQNGVINFWYYFTVQTVEDDVKPLYFWA